MTVKDLKIEKATNYIHYIILPLKIVACWDWFPKPKRNREILMNNIYLGMVLFVLTYMPVALAVHLYTEWQDIMSSLDKIADCLPLLVSVAIVSYYALYRKDLYTLVDYMEKNFKHHSARGLTNMTMWGSYCKARNFGRIYTACTMFSVTMYVTLPLILHLWTKEPIQSWVYSDVTQSPFLEFVFLRSFLTQFFVGLAMGQFGVFFAANSILICGQLDLLCCSLRNARYSALLRRGVRYSALFAARAEFTADERHNYIYNVAETINSDFHYDRKVVPTCALESYCDMYSSEYDEATVDALCDCARLCQIIKQYKEMFETFVSPLLVLRVVQVTLYLCTLLYAATLADRVSTAAYQSAWHTMGVKPRRMLLNILQANRRPVVVRAGRFLPMDLHTFIIKTSFSYYTLLVNVNEK
ncbi:hypothetical protein O3G_MSEX010527 [Manduca sexta]|uniref:Odorant receptor n=1 Tax=Manduca sexta TaxID=7130 RepID=A0A921ZI26_MANSE|nr:hypothetical protein O3G_MSEX010527 [Manduca sexta]